ncbi:hypothetical protein F5Y05DRAFT_235164 [Hypoxylon sp. FL0543]|nr:hypothetical protein F5Y05DRAFT_235164 [Hypoxylon sp. FL0543]
MSSHRVPEVLMKKVDEYVDSLAPQVQPRIATELDVFQQKTIDVLETQVIEAFRSLFDRDGNRDGAAYPGTLRSLDDAIPNAYGGQSLPFANEIVSLTGSFSKIADEATDDLHDIFSLTEGHAGSGSGNTRALGERHSDSSQRVRGFLSAAVNAVQDRLDDQNSGKGPAGQRFELNGLLGVLSNNVKDVARSPEDTARRISPEIKDKVAAKLREHHAPVAEQFTRIALDHIKRWLRGNTSTRDLGDGAKGEIEDHVKDLVKGIGGLFGNKKDRGESSSRGLGEEEGGGGGGAGFSKVISEKLSTGLARVHREVRLDFRKVLGGIETQLFDSLPDQLQGPLEKILGGNPFDSQLERDAGPQADRGFGDDIKAKLVSKIRGLVRKVQEMLRESILGVVDGGHRKLERESWVFVQDIVEQKVQRYLPKVKINVPDDIGNEGVDLGTPKPSAQPEAGHQFAPSPEGGYQQAHQTDYPQYQHQPHQQYRPDQYRPPHQGYTPSDQYQPPQNYQQSQEYQDNQWHGQNPPY